VKSARLTSQFGPGLAVLNLSVTRRYVSRVTPFPLPVPPDPGRAPAAPLYAASLQQGVGYGVGTQGDAWGDYKEYEFLMTCTPRDYAVKDDNAVRADLYNFPSTPSPLVDPTAGVSYPDEGTMLREGWDVTRYVTRRIYPAGRLIEVPGAFCRFTNGDVVPGNQPVREAIFNCVYTWRLVPIAAVPFNAIQKALNAVNHDDFDVWPAGTMMLVDFKYDPQPGPLGDWLTDVAYTFQVKLGTDRNGVPRGHSSGLRHIDGVGVDYMGIVCQGNTSRQIFRRWPMDSLFRPDQVNWQPDAGPGGG
jgi:hypothetical protein